MHEHDRRGFYRVLEADPNFSAAEIKRSYRRLALRHHPDVASSDKERKSHHSRMSLLNEAYETLRDPARRDGYNRECAFPRCVLHPRAYLSGICSRCSEPVCPGCCPDGTVCCSACTERLDRRRRTKDPVDRALLALEDGDLIAAREDLDRALLVNPRDVVALTALSTLREKCGDLPGAIMALSLAMEAKPGHSFSYYRLGLLYERMGEIGKAETSLVEALRLDPGSSKFRGALSTLRSRENDRTPRFRPNDPVSHDRFGAGIVQEVTALGVKVSFSDGTARWLDPERSPMSPG